MTDVTKRKTPNKFRAVLLAPFLIPLFAIGWCLYWIGTQNPKPMKQKQANKTPEKKDNLELTVILPEKEILAS